MRVKLFQTNKMLRLLLLLVLAMAWGGAAWAQVGNLAKIDPELQEQMHQSRDANERFCVIVEMAEQYDNSNLERGTAMMTRAQRRDYVVNELKRFSERSQTEVVNFLTVRGTCGQVNVLHRFWIFNGLCCEATAECIGELSTRCDVRYVSLDKEIELDEPERTEGTRENQSTNDVEWHVSKVRANKVWNDLGYKGSGIVVAILDTGVNYNHPDLSDNMWNKSTDSDYNPLYPNHGWDFYDDDNDPMDINEDPDAIDPNIAHGSMVTGVVVGKEGIGIAPNAAIMALRINTNDDILSAIEFALEHGADVLNLSRGWPGVGGMASYRDSFVNVMNAGMVATVAAGNYGNQQDVYAVPNNVTAPGNCPPPWHNPNQMSFSTGGSSAVICVGNTTQDDLRNPSSSIGPVTWAMGEFIGSYNDYLYFPESPTSISGLIRPDVSAPGTDIYSLRYDESLYYIASGTSMASPCVAGIIALMLEANPNLTPAQIDEILETTVVACDGQTYKNNEYGAGRVDAYAAVTAVLNMKTITTDAFPTVGGTVAGGGSYLEGEQCTLTATPNLGYAFAGWYNGAILVSMSPSYTFTVNGDRSLTAMFAPSNNTITATASPTEGGIVNGAGTYQQGQTCTLTATPNTGYTFTNWTENDQVVSTESTYSFIVMGNRNLVAHFVQVPEGNIDFADKNVKSICVANWDSNGDGELSYAEAAVVTNLGGAFQDNWEITTFDELRYFIGLTSIGDHAFSSTSLTSVMIPNSVTSIGNYVFAFCSGLEQIVVDAGNTVYDSRNNCNAIIETATNTLIAGCKNTVIPNSVTSIGDYAFFSCTGLTSIEIPNSVTSIGNYAFYICTGLTSIEIPNSVTSIGQSAFSYCSSLTSMMVAADNAVYDSRDNCNAIIETETNTLVAGCKNTVVPNSVTSIGQYAFYYCYGLTSIEIPNSVISIGQSAFAYCSGLTTVEIPNSVTSIEDATFEICYNLTSVIIPNSVTSIGQSAFSYCYNLTSVAIPNSIISIGQYAFNSCTGLTSMYIYAETPPTLGDYAFNGVNVDIPVYVPCESAESYITEGWGGFNNILGLCDGTVTVEAVPIEGGSVSGAGMFQGGDECTVTAMPNTGYVFGNWTMNGIVVSTSAEYTFLVAGNINMVANFVFVGAGSYVDLGLPSGTLWANCNIGANAPEQFGDYFAWGETQPKSEYTWDTYLHYDGGNITKYAEEDGLTALLPEDDAVTAYWGSDWMIPTNEQWHELIDNTYKEWTTQNGVNGWCFTSWWNGNSVFLPVAGRYSEWYEGDYYDYQIYYGLNGVGEYGIYWSVSLDADYVSEARGVWLGSDYFSNSSASRYYGSSVRAVRYMPFAINASVNPVESGTVSGEGTYERGETCTVVARPSAGYLFVNWTENGNVVSNEATYSFIATINRNLVANFAMPVITATANPEEGGTVAGVGEYGYGTLCTLTATPIGNYTFVNWTENGEVVSTEATYTFTVTGDRNLEANFIMPVITATANPEEGGCVTGSGEYVLGSQCTVTATPNEGYSFTNWTDNGEVVSTEATYTFTVNDDRNLVANFKYADINITDGVLPGQFSINPHHQVNFSQGNLQYIGSTGSGDENNTGAYWKFAEHQWDFFGNNDQCSDLQTANRDLFGWGTSGYNHGAVCYQPWSTSNNRNDYNAYGCDTYNLFDYTVQADWGYNAISNGGNTENSGWRTLTCEEWQYLLYTRNTASGMRYTNAQVNGVTGMVLLPDDWNISYFDLSNPNDEEFVITASQWKVLEQHGAVFLPYTNYRRGTNYYNYGGYYSYYWLASAAADGIAYYVSGNSIKTSSRSTGMSVRLARPSQSYSFAINVAANPMEGGSVSGEGIYEGDAECTLVATANTGFIFVNWTEKGEVVSTEATYNFTVTGGRTLVANFRNANANITDGALAGMFSVSDGKLVSFSQGNLQYIGSADTPHWKFAEHQWDYFGDNGQASNDINANRDLFCWGTSGYNHGANCYQPWSTSSNHSDYYAYVNATYNLYDRTGKADWGYNAIANGGNQENGGWRTMTQEEWNYIINTRNTNSGIRYAKATVNNVYGLILLPDNWNSSYYALNDTNQTDADCSANVISASQWNVLEQHGATFLPVTGHLYNGEYQQIWGSGIYDDTLCGGYWSSSRYFNEDYGYSYNNQGAFGVGLSNLQGDSIFIDGLYRGYGCAVRLVRSDVTHGINATSNSEERGTTDGSGTYHQGTRATITALANPGYAFINWTENGMLVSTEVSYSFTVTENRNLVANFSVLGTTPTGGVSGMFSVSNGQQVYFSQGNLQYIGSAGNGDENNTGAYWKFAEHQWDILGDNGQGSDTLLLVDRDLFGWGTSGYEHGAVNYQPWTTAMNVSQSAYYYYAYGCNNCNLFDESGIADWGYNAILNGGNTENSGWRTPTHEEYEYLLNTRSTVSDIRYAKAQVNGINGLVLLPDNWNRSYYKLNNTNLSNVDFSSNIITLEQWSTLEQHGAVFLPAAGYRSGTIISYLQEGNYWSASSYNQMSAYRLRITNSDCYVNSNRRGYGQSVRLVRSIHTYCINATPNLIQSGIINGSGIYFENATCTLTATTITGYTFNNWTENGTVVSTNASYSFTVTEDRNLVANFTPIAFHFITAGTWSNASNWSGGVLPGANEEAFIDAPCQLDQNATVAALTVSDGQSLTLQSGKTLTVTNTLINTATTGLIIEDGAQLVHASENVCATVKKSITGHGTNRGKYSLISNPLATTVNPELASIYHLTRGNYDLYDWLPNTPDNLEWRNYKDNDFMMLPDGYGYLYANQNGVELSFPGTLKPSNNRLGKSVSYDSGNTEHLGWNLIGNPFMCNAYLVNGNNEPLPYYRMNAAGNGFEAVASGTPIAPMEGVFYKASGNGTVYFIGADYYDSHAYVDLGLPSGLLWATCNIGADSPEDYGDYFAWGETQPKDTYNWSTYQYCMGSNNTLTKYCNNSNYGYNGFTDNLTTLLPEDDAATANWGSGWRMPTQEEWQELYNNTTVTWTQQNGVNGRLFTAANGNILFLPAVGWNTGSPSEIGRFGIYWSSSLFSPDISWTCVFDSNDCIMYFYGRANGQSVRPVRSSLQN